MPILNQGGFQPRVAERRQACIRRRVNERCPIFEEESVNLNFYARVRTPDCD